MNVIKNKRDFVLGLIALALSLFLLLSDSVIQGFSLFQTKIYLAQAGAYIEIIAVLMIIVSLAMIVRAFVKAEPDETQKKSLDLLVVGAFAALIVYLLLMDALGLRMTLAPLCEQVKRWYASILGIVTFLFSLALSL